MAGARAHEDRHLLSMICQEQPHTLRADLAEIRRALEVLAESGTDDFRDFVTGVAERLERGEQEYAGSALTRPLPSLGREIEEEALDLAGWAFFVWMRARRLRRALERIVEREGEGR